MEPPVDDRARYGRFPIEEAICWNGLTESQQYDISTSGIVPSKLGGGHCPNRAQVAVDVGPYPGPRFYCQTCAAKIKLEQIR
jgi:hypothetical protein